MDDVSSVVEAVVALVEDGEAAASSFEPAMLEDGLPGEVPSLSDLVMVDGGLAAVMVARVLASLGSGMLAVESSDLRSMVWVIAGESSGKNALTRDTAVCSLIRKTSLMFGWQACVSCKSNLCKASSIQISRVAIESVVYNSGCDAASYVKRWCRRAVVFTIKNVYLHAKAARLPLLTW